MYVYYGYRCIYIVCRYRWVLGARLAARARILDGCQHTRCVSAYH